MYSKTARKKHKKHKNGDRPMYMNTQYQRCAEANILTSADGRYPFFQAAEMYSVFSCNNAQQTITKTVLNTATV